MSKVCSLDFLNKEEFDLEIISAGGKTLFSKGDKVTPEILLSLYFKELVVRESLKTPEELAMEAKKAAMQAEMDRLSASFDPEKSLEKLLEGNLPINLEFDKDHANRIMKLSYDFGVVIGLSEKQLEEVKQASYYYKIGIIKLTSDDLSDASFETQVAEIGFDLLTLEIKMPNHTAEVTRMYAENYDCSKFSLASKKSINIPYYHIVAITDYYDRLITKNAIPKEEALHRMLKLGGNKFNIFILHKFINMMRNAND